MGAMATSRSGHELPLLLLGAFRALVDDLHLALAERGHPGVRPVHGFALQAVGDGATTSELGRRLGVSKQAAAKTAAALVTLGYLEERASPTDRRTRPLHRTAHGDDCLRASAETFDQLRQRWVDQLGADRVAAIEDDLEAVTRADTRRADAPGWFG